MCDNPGAPLSVQPRQTPNTSQNRIGGVLRSQVARTPAKTPEFALRPPKELTL